jgi:hypothetical protein
VGGIPGQQGEILISGTVTDATSNEPLPGASVLVKGISIGTVTDPDGKYSIHVPVGASLQFSFIGYLKEEFTITWWRGFKAISWLVVNDKIIKNNPITDIIGSVQSCRLITCEPIIHLSVGLPDGMYVVKISNDRQFQPKKIVVNSN